MNKLLDELKDRGISVSFCAKLLRMPKRTLQDHLDVPSRLVEVEEKKLKLIMRNHDDLKVKVNAIK